MPLIFHAGGEVLVIVGGIILIVGGCGGGRHGGKHRVVACWSTQGRIQRGTSGGETPP
jgi:hypothetical protein